MIDLLARLRGVRACGRDRWTARCPAHDDRRPSLSVAHVDGKWLLKCWANCDVADIVAALGLTMRDLFDDTHSYSERRKTLNVPLQSIRDIVRDVVFDAETARRLERARGIWRASRRHDLGRIDSYLASRGVPRPSTGHVRFHPALRHPKSGRTWPAMIWLITNPISGEPLGVHATFLDDVGVGKAPIEPAKMTFGLIRGGVIRLTPPQQPDSGEPLILAEGVETALSALAAGYRHAWAAISASNMRSIDLSESIRDIVIVADNDDGGTGMAAARDLAGRLHRQGRRARIPMPPVPGTDLNNLLGASSADEEAAA
jgi:hypothetical protein